MFRAIRRRTCTVSGSLGVTLRGPLLLIGFIYYSRFCAILQAPSEKNIPAQLTDLSRL